MLSVLLFYMILDKVTFHCSVCFHHHLLKIGILSSFAWKVYWIIMEYKLSLLLIMLCSFKLFFFYITLLLMERNVTGICVVILYLMELDNLFITSNTLWTFRNVPYMQSFYLQIDTELWTLWPAKPVQESGIQVQWDTWLKLQIESRRGRFPMIFSDLHSHIHG